MTHYDHEETQEGFQITLELLEEFDHPDWDFESEEDRQKTLHKIENGSLLWFCAKVSARKEGIELGNSYLGGCCYKSVADFITPNDYYGDMKAEAIREAKETLRKLCA